MSQITAEKICISCPVGCHLKIEWQEATKSDLIITGNQCKRGILYAENEMRHPMRFATMTVRICGGKIERLPVKTSEPIPKELVKPLCQFTETIEVNAPIVIGEIVIKNILNSGADLVACRTKEAI